MNGKLLIYVSLFTVVVCCIFTTYNPNIATPYPSDFTAGEVFNPENGQFDFRDFTVNSKNTRNFTTKIISSGHTQFIDDTGNITVNFIELDKMIQSSRDMTNSILDGELEKPSWTVDGISVHEIDFPDGELYSAYQKNSSENTIIYLSTPNEKDTADLMNSLTFK